MPASIRTPIPSAEQLGCGVRLLRLERDLTFGPLDAGDGADQGGGIPAPDNRPRPPCQTPGHDRFAVRSGPWRPVGPASSPTSASISTDLNLEADGGGDGQQPLARDSGVRLETPADAA